MRLALPCRWALCIAVSILACAPPPATAGASGSLTRATARALEKAAARGAAKGVARGAERGALRGAERSALGVADRAATGSVWQGSVKAVVRPTSRAAVGPNPRVTAPPRQVTTRTPQEQARLDYLRHRHEAMERPMLPLDRPERVRRYVGADEARGARAGGVAPLSYWTPAKPGPPMGPSRATRELGLQRAPSHVIEGRIPAGTEVSRGRVLGGRGPEVLSKDRVSASTIRVKKLGCSAPNAPPAKPPAPH